MSPIGYLETGAILRADNLDELKEFPSECVDLIYLDPPFFSNKQYEVIWGDEAEVRSFEDRWKGGINVYVEWMRERLIHMHRVLKPTGSLYLHCDSNASHYLKVTTDSIFDRRNFRNEIIWRRTGSNSARARFGPLHQSILYYVKSNAAPYYPVHAPYTDGYVRDYFTHEDHRGRYRSVLLTGPGRREGDSGKPWRNYDPTTSGRHWQPASYLYDKYRQVTGDDLAKYPLIERLDKLDEVGLIHWAKKAGGGVPNYKYYLADAPGVALQDIWAYQPGTEGAVYGRPDEGIDQDVKWLGSKDRERLGYPTQKPEGVLERIIRSSSKAGDIVLDPFCGCGTSVAVAEKLGRQWIGIDISPTAVNLIVRRMIRLGVDNVITHGLPQTENDLRKLKPFEFQNWIVQQVNGTHAPRKSGDMGIDGYSFFDRLPIQVKQSDRVGRNVVDNFETATRRDKKHKGYIFAFSFTRGAYEEAARAKSEGLEIALVTIAELLAPVPPPPKEPVEPGQDMILDLNEAIRRAKQDFSGSTPERSAEELMASDLGAG